MKFVKLMDDELLNLEGVQKINKKDEKEESFYGTSFLNASPTYNIILSWPGLLGATITLRYNEKEDRDVDYRKIELILTDCIFKS